MKKILVKLLITACLLHHHGFCNAAPSPLPMESHERNTHEAVSHYFPDLVRVRGRKDQPGDLFQPQTARPDATRYHETASHSGSQSVRFRNVNDVFSHLGHGSISSAGAFQDNPRHLAHGALPESSLSGSDNDYMYQGTSPDHFSHYSAGGTSTFNSFDPIIYGVQVGYPGYDYTMHPNHMQSPTLPFSQDSVPFGHVDIPLGGEGGSALDRPLIALEFPVSRDEERSYSYYPPDYVQNFSSRTPLTQHQTPFSTYEAGNYLTASKHFTPTHTLSERVYVTSSQPRLKIPPEHRARLKTPLTSQKYNQDLLTQSSWQNYSDGEKGLLLDILHIHTGYMRETIAMKCRRYFTDVMRDAVLSNDRDRIKQIRDFMFIPPKSSTFANKMLEQTWMEHMTIEQSIEVVQKMADACGKRAEKVRNFFLKHQLPEKKAWKILRDNSVDNRVCKRYMHEMRLNLPFYEAWPWMKGIGEQHRKCIVQKMMFATGYDKKKCYRLLESDHGQDRLGAKIYKATNNGVREIVRSLEGNVETA
ncbi:hypothetical protein CBS101457_000128 [Exobasidium rhododendri]|nr:hypothetical protein CBS101457_000128 [Exobasidium rhododendri]